MKDYQRRFEQLAARASSLTQKQKVEIFISGLKGAIAIEVELQHPTNLTNAMSLARLYERRRNSHREEPSGLRRSTTNGAARLPFVKRLSRAEMEEHRKKGLCYNCDELYTAGHQCKRLFWLERIDESHLEPDILVEETKEPEISIHAITGLDKSQTMQVKGCINGQTLLILIDSGSIHSFVDEAWVDQLKLNTETKASLRQWQMAKNCAVQGYADPFQYSWELKPSALTYFYCHFVVLVPCWE